MKSNLLKIENTDQIKISRAVSSEFNFVGKIIQRKIIFFLSLFNYIDKILIWLWDWDTSFLDIRNKKESNISLLCHVFQTIIVIVPIQNTNLSFRILFYFFISRSCQHFQSCHNFLPTKWIFLKAILHKL